MNKLREMQSITQKTQKLLVTVLLAGLFSLLYLSLGLAQAESPEAITVCSTGCDFTTIQQAVDANGTKAGDLIRVMDAIHTEGGIVVSKDITLEGLGAAATIVQAHANLEQARQRVFLIPKGASVVIRAMTVRHGNPQEEPMGGGGIRNEGVLQVEECVVSHNQAGSGGGLYNTGTLTLVDSIVSSNTTFGGAAILECNNGGGIKSLEGIVTLIRSTVSGNNAIGKGGGLHIACKSTLVMTNSTISGNNTPYDGGGIYLDGVAEITHSTIVGNLAHDGGGIYADGTPEEGSVLGLLNYSNTVIAGNTITFLEYGVADCKIGEHASVGVNINNFVGDGSCTALLSGDPRLGALEDNDGLTLTHAPLPDSPLLEAVSLDLCAEKEDQRGVERPSGKGCDIGAVELSVENKGITTPWLLGASLVLLIAIGLVFVLRLRRKG